MTTFKKSRRPLMRLGSAGTLVVMAALAVALLSGSGLARAAGPASHWQIGSYTPSGQNLSFASAPSAAPSGIASLNFTNQSNTALLVTKNKAKFPDLLGDLTNKTVTATFTVRHANTFTYGGEPDGSGLPATVRLFFETNNAGGFDSTHYWWSNPASEVLRNGTFTVTAAIDPALWSDWNGQIGTSVPDKFEDAASNVTMIGLSFGGGYFFENGVGTTDGSGTFILSSYTAS